MKSLFLTYQTTLVHEDTFGEAEFTSTRTHLSTNLMIFMCFTFNEFQRPKPTPLAQGFDSAVAAASEVIRLPG